MRRLNKSQRFTTFPTTTGSADTVDVVVVGVWLVEVDDVRDIRDVETTSSDVGCDENFHLLVFEGLKGTLALRLRFITMNRLSWDA